LTYDPFARGPFPVGVQTRSVRDDARDRELPLEIWYPAADAHAGRDLDDITRDRYRLLPALPETAQDAERNAAPREGRFPLVGFSHGFGGHRRQSTFYCTHLASHGYVVVAMDHVGNTVGDMMQMLAGLPSAGTPPGADDVLRPPSEYRPSDWSLAVDAVLDGAVPELAARVDPDRIAATGHSFGGWTSLAVAGRDARVRAAVPLAPAGGAPSGEGDPLPDLLELGWSREVPTLFLVAERDSLLALSGMRRLLERTRGPARMAVLRDADHQHFCDQAEQVHEITRALAAAAPPTLGRGLPQLPPIGELCPGAHGELFTRGLGLAHLDAHLRDLAAAADLLEEAEAVLAARDVAIELIAS
jgi:dienelactone hydrolase